MKRKIYFDLGDCGSVVEFKSESELLAAITTALNLDCKIIVKTKKQPTSANKASCSSQECQ